MTLGPVPLSVRRLGLAVALVLGPLAVLEVVRGPGGGGAFGPPSDVVGVALALVAVLPLVAVDLRPRAAVVVSAAGYSLGMVAGVASNLQALALLLVVGACAFRAGRPAGVVAVLAGWAGLVLAPALTPSAPAVANALTNALLTAASALVGLSAGTQRRYAVQLEHHARALEELRATEVREVVAQERLRIAREVHDVVGHALAAIALHARVGTRRLGRSPSGTAQSLAEISELAASALAETREAVGQLRTADGAAGFLLKDAEPDDVFAAIRTVSRGHGLIAPEVTRRLIARFAAISPTAERGRLLETLSAREREVLVLLASGMSNAEIARALWLEEATIKSHVSRLLSKLDLRSRVQAVIFAYETGVVTAGAGPSDPPA